MTTSSTAHLVVAAAPGPAGPQDRPDTPVAVLDARGRPHVTAATVLAEGNLVPVLRGQ